MSVSVTGSRISQAVLLLSKLDKEICNNIRTNEFIDDLQMFENRREQQEFPSLQQKLERADRKHEIESAEMKQEYFAMLLLRFRHFPSAQKLFALFLWRINDVFESHIIPNVQNLNHSEVEKIVETMIIEPIIADMGNGFEHFTLTHGHVRGMIYWLADRCFVRWH